MKKKISVVMLDNKESVPSWSYRLMIAALLMGCSAITSAASVDKNMGGALLLGTLSILGFYACTFYIETLVKNHKMI